MLRLIEPLVTRSLLVTAMPKYVADGMLCIMIDRSNARRLHATLVAP